MDEVESGMSRFCRILVYLGIGGCCSFTLSSTDIPEKSLESFIRGTDGWVPPGLKVFLAVMWLFYK
ncbi:rCG35793 [Rattus norvegicus]|uniref:RCG35793 n=1 Tax=Rattus norvegicus TaxID=10116 RepID=A6IJQ2_RAT|nr:rCG35793 [Rattus norvegicus]